MTLENGDTIQGEGECHGLQIEILGITLIEDFLILELRNAWRGVHQLETSADAFCVE